MWRVSLGKGGSYPEHRLLNRAERDKVSDRVDLKPLNDRLTVEERSASGADRREVGR